MLRKENKRKQKPLLSSWEVAKLHWKAQALGNLFFGLPLVIIILAYGKFSLAAARSLTVLYLSEYILIFVPFFAGLPLLFLRPVKKILAKVQQGEQLAKEEILSAIERLLNLPGRMSLVIALAVPLGFAIGVFVLYQGLILEFMPIINVIVTIGLVVGIIVAIVHSFFNYIFLEIYLKKPVEFLLSLYPETSKKDLRIRKFPLFFKIFFLVLLAVMAAQFSLATLFLSKIAISFPQELKNSFYYAGSLLVLALVYVFFITVIFTRNLFYPLKKLIFWARGAIEDKSKKDIVIMTNDEIAEVIEYTKRIVMQLREAEQVLSIKVQARTKELEELIEKREETIKERTKELQEKIQELEKFHKLAVGRELKMVELKKEMERLKKLLKSK